MLGLRVICKNVTVTSGADRLKQQRKQQSLTQCQHHRHGDDRSVVGCALVLHGFGYFGLVW